MRTIEAAIAELRALGRPQMPFLSPKDFPRWRNDLAAWNALNPGAEARYVALLDEVERLERRLPASPASQWAERAGVPERVVQAIAELRDTEAVTRARHWLEGPQSWLLMLGATGTGKSVAAGCVLREAMGAGKSGAWVQAADFARLAGGFDGAADHLGAVGLLVVDDVGTEHASDFARATMAGVLLTRHEARLRTVLTSNLDGPGLRQRLGERLGDRIRGECSVVTLAGKSMRGAP